MSTVYTGVSTGIAPGDAVQVTNPVDGDALTAASNNAAIQTLANIVRFLQERTLFNNNYQNIPASANQPGGRFKGTGTGSGVLANTDAAAPNGTAAISGTGLGANTKGVWGVGTGTEAGIYGQGAAAGGVFLATTAGPGVTGTGAGGGNGGTFLGQGAGVGVNATGGASSGAGGNFTGGASNGHGVIATGQGTGYGVLANSGGTNAAIFAANGGGTDSLVETIRLNNGHVKFIGSNPAYNATLPANTLVPTQLIKAWGQFTWNNGAPALSTFGYNMSSINSPSNGNVDLTFVTTITSGILVIAMASGGFTARMSTAFANRIVVQDTVAPTPGNVNFSVTTGTVNFLVLGLQ